MHYAETKYGFEWGAAKITRCCFNAKAGWVVLVLETPKHKGTKALQIYVTKTGKVRIHAGNGEWNEPLTNENQSNTVERLLKEMKEETK